MTTIREHDEEGVPGLPDRLPDGEKVLWQGSPRWQSLARRAFHVRAIALYFAAIAAWSAWASAAEGAGAGSIAQEVLWLALVGSLPIALLVGIAMLSARTTLYTVTDRRLVLRIGIALMLKGTALTIEAVSGGAMPYVATVVVLALISRNPLWIRINMPASIGKPFHPGG